MSGCTPWNAKTGRVTTGLALLALSVMSGCHHAGGVAAAPSELRVGMATVYKPLAFKENGQLAGVEADFAHRLAADLKVKVTLVELPWDDLIPALVDHRIDVIMSGMSITESRSQLVSFTQPYLRVGQMALIRRSDYAKLRDPKMMNATASRVGYHSGTTSEAFVRAKLAAATLVGFDSPEAGVAALRAGKIDYFVHDAPTIWRISGGLEGRDPDLRGLYRPLTEEYLAWAVRKDDTPLRDRLNETLVHWQATGETEAVLDRWIPVRKVTVDAKPSK
jgi:ABC-type amino acid transport substrate-binding protein